MLFTVSERFTYGLRSPYFNVCVFFEIETYLSFFSKQTLVRQGRFSLYGRYANKDGSFETGIPKLTVPEQMDKPQRNLPN